jgi:hypothetical protein
MTIKELKEFLETLPEEFNDYRVVNGEYGKFSVTDEFHYRTDKPVNASIVDEQTKELCLLHQTEEEINEIKN